MKFSVKKNDLQNVLANIQGLTSRKSSLAITTTVLIRAVKTGITLVATDLETGFEGSYPAHVESEGSIAINSRKLFEIVKDFPSEEIFFEEVENNWINIGNEKVQFNIVGMNSEDFPEIPHFENIKLFEIGSRKLKSMIEKTVFLVGATDDKRPHIIGNYLEKIIMKDHTVLRMVATDGGRLSKMDTIYEKDTNLPFEEGVLISKKGLHEVSKFLNLEGNVFLGFKNNKVIIKKNNETIIIRLLEGAFPEYEEIIIKDDANDIIIDRTFFLMMLKRMTIFFSENYRAVIFTFDDDRLIIKSTNPEIGESKEEMIIDYKKKAMKFAFNPKFFIEALNVIEESKIIINISEEEKPCMITGFGDTEYLSAIMPMRV